MAQPTIPGTGVGRPQMPYGSDGSNWYAIRLDSDGKIQVAMTFLPHASDHEDGGSDEIDVTALSGLLADDQHVLDAEVLLVAAALVHKARHVSGGADPFASTDLLEAIIKRIQTSTGPTTLLVGAIADGEYLKRDGTGVVGGTPAGGDSGEGNIPIWPLLYSSIIQGTWLLERDEQYNYDYVWRTDSPADQDEIHYQVYLDVGTYTFVVMALKSTGCGILKVYIDAVLVSTMDLYAGSVTFNNRLTETGIVIGTAGLKTLKFKVDGKHASSSSYAFYWTQAGLFRTA